MDCLKRTSINCYRLSTKLACQVSLPFSACGTLLFFAGTSISNFIFRQCLCCVRDIKSHEKFNALLQAIISRFISKLNTIGLPDNSQNGQGGWCGGRCGADRLQSQAHCVTDIQLPSAGDDDDDASREKVDSEKGQGDSDMKDSDSEQTQDCPSQEETKKDEKVDEEPSNAPVDVKETKPQEKCLI